MIEVGTRFPGGEVTLEGYEHWLACDAILAPPLPDGVGHPMFGYYLALQGMGWTLDELFARMDARASDGVLFGQADFDFFAPLRVGARYQVSGEVLSVVRKEGRSGAFDVLEFRLAVEEVGGELAAESVNWFLFPRRTAG